jgi:IS30 family transposase
MSAFGGKADITNPGRHVRFWPRADNPFCTTNVRIRGKADMVYCSANVPNNTHIRHTRFVMLLKIPSKDTATVVAALAKHVRKLPQELRRSLTWDRGKEMADHKSFTVATKVQVYFCDPRSPWQRGSSENTNGLLRQDFPKGADLSRFAQAYLNKIALRLNQRPRQTLGFETPADRLRAVLQ